MSTQHNKPNETAGLGAGKPPHCLDMAIRYGNSGYPIFPAKFGLKESHKSALHSNGIKWGATLDSKEITRNFLRWRNANIGLPTGNFLGKPNIKCLFVIDADTLAGGHKYDGIAGLAALEAKHGKLPPTRQSISPTGSVHSWWMSPAGVKIKTCQGTATKGIAPGVDVLGERAMILVPNSIAATTKGGKIFGEYRFLNNLPIADAPDWLVELCRDRTKTKQRDVDDDISEIDIDKVIDALDAATNVNVDEEKWHQLIASAWSGSGGAPEALAAFQRWSAKNKIKHNADRNEERWNHFLGNPPVQITVGTLYHHANETAEGWREAACAVAFAAMQKAYAAEIKAKFTGGRRNG